MKKVSFVYLVGSGDVESSRVRFVCRTEEKARERFEQVRNKLIKRYFNREKDKKLFHNWYEVLLKITFDNIKSSDFDTVQVIPYWKKIELD